MFFPLDYSHLYVTAVVFQPLANINFLYWAWSENFMRIDKQSIELDEK